MSEKKLVKVRIFTMPFDSKKFNKGQMVFIKEMDTCMAAKVVGRFRGDGAFATCWVSWDCACRGTPSIKAVTVPAVFARELSIEIIEEGEATCHKNQ